MRRFKIRYRDTFVLLAVTGVTHAVILVPLLLVFGLEAYTSLTEVAVAAASAFLASIVIKRYRARRWRKMLAKRQTISQWRSDDE